jgi:hypothetical protein
MSEPVKIMYFAPRPEGRSLADFRERWRQHGELGMSQPLWKHMYRYTQLDALTPEESGVNGAGISTAEAEVGGIGEIWVHSDEELEEVFADPSSAAMPPDEIETFGRELGALLLPTREQVLIDDGPVALWMVGLIHRPAAFPKGGFSERWLESGQHFIGLEEISRHVSRYVQNHVLPPSVEADGVVQLGFSSADAANAFFAEPKLGEEMVPYEADFVDHSRMTTVLARANVLYDVDPAARAAN